ncbi:hypothetical protein HDU98_001268 [Podochytrium sp. JEL0797]|nr:hypothetical protein HDU98_001268 [Podochytrium sp. JEL0797]
MPAKQSRIQEQITTLSPQLPLHTSLPSLQTSPSSLQTQTTFFNHPSNPTSTLLTDLPSEVVTHILSWINPTSVCKLRALNSAFRACISTSAFARLNLSRTLPNPKPTVTESLHPSEDDILYLRSPPVYQTIYIQTYWKHITRFSWGGHHSDEDPPDAEFPAEYHLNIHLPHSWMHQRNLMHLALTWCNLNGRIPHEVGHLQNLMTLDLSFNNLEGGIPSGIAGLSKLETLRLACNQLCGDIPVELGALRKLKYLDLSENTDLSGHIPRELGSLSNLIKLLIFNCNLTGPIPAELAWLTRLEELSLGLNSLEGSVPMELGTLNRLRYFNLCENVGVTCHVEFRQGVLRI